MPLNLPRLASWLRCPACAADLEAVDRLTLGCASGHRHDANKRGYVTLLGSGTRHVGDTAAMLDAREAVLGSGLFAAVAEAVAVAATGPRILDAGAGTGHYLRTALDAHPDALGLAMDLSPAAVARAVRASERIDGLVADTWRPLPIRSGAGDSVVDVFAPRNLPEFRRVLRPGGTLVIVVPRPDHLASLRASGTMLDIPGDKAEDVITASAALYTLETREHITATHPVDVALRDALVGMGPSARHASAAAAPDADATTVSVDVLRLRAR